MENQARSAYARLSIERERPDSINRMEEREKGEDEEQRKEEKEIEGERKIESKGIFMAKRKKESLVHIFSVLLF